MRLAVIADIHGNFRALQAVLQDLEGQRVDRTVSLGDNIGYGPEPDEVVRELTAKQVLSVMGNHELALVDPGYHARLNPPARESLALSRTLLSADSLAWLTALHPVIISAGARFVHGSPPVSITAYLYNPSPARLKRIFQSYPEAVGFAGHTHTLDVFSQSPGGEIVTREPAVETLTLTGGWRYLIVPGSVGQPRDSVDNGAKYGIWDEEAATFEIRSVSYDVETTVRLLQERGFPLQNAQRLQW